MKTVLSKDILDIKGYTRKRRNASTYYKPTYIRL